MAVPLFFASSSISTFVGGIVLTLSPLTRIFCSMNWISSPPLEFFSLPRVEPDDVLAVGRLLLSDVAGPWLAVGLFDLFYSFKAPQELSKMRPILHEIDWHK